MPKRHRPCSPSLPPASNDIEPLPGQQRRFLRRSPRFFNNFNKLATVEVQLVFQFLPAEEKLMLARCNRSLCKAADNHFAWTGAIFDVDDLHSDQDVELQTARISKSLARHASLRIQQSTEAPDTGTFLPLNFSPMVQNRFRIADVKLMLLPWSAEKVAVIRQMRWLERLHIVRFENAHPSSFLSLLRRGHCFQQLRQLSMERYVFRKHYMDLMLLLPSLEILEPAELTPECWEQLPELSQLRVLQIGCSDRNIPADCVRKLSVALASLRHLAELTINWWNPHPSQPQQHLELQLPTATRIDLRGPCLRLDSVSGFQQCPCLTDLSLRHISGMDAPIITKELLKHVLLPYPNRLKCLSIVMDPELTAEEKLLLSSVLKPPKPLDYVYI